MHARGVERAARGAPQQYHAALQRDRHGGVRRREPHHRVHGRAEDVPRDPLHAARLVEGGAQLERAHALQRARLQQPHVPVYVPDRDALPVDVRGDASHRLPAPVDAQRLPFALGRLPALRDEHDAFDRGAATGKEGDWESARYGACEYHRCLAHILPNAARGSAARVLHGVAATDVCWSA